MIHMLRKEIKNWNFVWWLVLIAIGGQTLFLRAPRGGKEVRIASVNGQHLTVADLRRAMSQEKDTKPTTSTYETGGRSTPEKPSDGTKRPYATLDLKATEVAAAASADKIAGTAATGDKSDAAAKPTNTEPKFLPDARPCGRWHRWPLWLLGLV